MMIQKSLEETRKRVLMPRGVSRLTKSHKDNTNDVAQQRLRSKNATASERRCSVRIQLSMNCNSPGVEMWWKVMPPR